ncbi:transketolase [Pelagicoccus sp. SDUM812005]|uniref:transketolase n=1 Tax=Pelagicoccus sp. SDUM812005 TaxID=3041257 RepID=UPI00280EE737|nr:transketolase [Pelagicoccus sp. SDUM812005]MDQ8180932.1 transketolase [Pelagicoccus sp. SDUM812005]
MTDPKHLYHLSQEARSLVVKMIYKAKASHIGGAFSVIDILTSLYLGNILKVSPDSPDAPDRDRLIFSKGHCTSALYAVLAMKGFFSKDLLERFGEDESLLLCHTSHHLPGVEFSTGSLGHGLSFATGCALAAKRLSRTWKTYAILSDGELNEGSTWEAIQSAAHLRLNNLVAVIDANRSQGLGNTDSVLKLTPLAGKFAAFNWDVIEIEGHDHEQILHATSIDRSEHDSPLCIIAHTTKGKGVNFMEGKLEWHYRSPNEKERDQALEQLSR